MKAEAIEVNVSHHVLDRAFLLNMIQKQIDEKESLLIQNIKERESISDIISFMPRKERSKSNTKYADLNNRRIKLSHNNKTLQNQIKRLRFELNKYSTIEI